MVNLCITHCQSSPNALASSVHPSGHPCKVAAMFLARCIGHNRPIASLIPEDRVVCVLVPALVCACVLLAAVSQSGRNGSILHPLCSCLDDSACNDFTNCCVTYDIHTYVYNKMVILQWFGHILWILIMQTPLLLPPPPHIQSCPIAIQLCNATSQTQCPACSWNSSGARDKEGDQCGKTWK